MRSTGVPDSASQMARSLTLTPACENRLTTDTAQGSHNAPHRKEPEVLGSTLALEWVLKKWAQVLERKQQILSNLLAGEDSETDFALTGA